MSVPPRVVLDTNIVLSALIFGHGRLAPLRHAWQQERLRPLISKATAAELIRALAYPKFKLSIEDRHELLGEYLPWCTAVAIPAEPPRTPRCRDPFDLPFLQLAITGKADYLVTGDDDLLALSGEFCYRIVTGAEFLSTL